ncbi:integrase family protein [Polaromonas sp. P2-4]|nr:integrase family protein [Polaromonas sp. P2-4]
MARKIVGTDLNFDPEFRFLLAIDPDFEEWRLLAAKWWGTQKDSQPKQTALAGFFVRYLHAMNLDKHPASLLDAQFKPPSLEKPLGLADLSVNALRRHDAISDFLDWVLREKFAEPDALGHRLVPSHMRNPFPRLRSKRTGKGSDIDFRYVLQHDPRMEDWRALAAEWLDAQRMATDAKRKALDKFLVGYIIQHGLERNPYTVLRRDTLKPPFIDMVLAAKRGANERGGTLKPQGCDIRLNNHAHDFLAWVLSEKLSVDDDNGHRVTSTEFHNPIARLANTGLTLTETLKTPLPYRYIKQLRTMLAQGSTLREWTWAQQSLEGGRGGDWFVVDPGLVNPDDPDCVWRERATTSHERKFHDVPDIVTELWSPVRAVALYLKLELPLRTFQVRMLDSGEADTWRYEVGKFVRNDSLLAIGSEKRPSQRGVFHRSSSEAGAGFFINTNKTADINKDESAKGYTIPWTYEPALYWMEKLRNWQERYNPISAPMPWRELEAKHFGLTPPHQAVLDERSDVCFLFRDATASGTDCQKPIPDQRLFSLWHQLLTRLEKQCSDNDETLDNGTPIRFVDPNSALVTHYPLHALRVSLITAYALEGGVPFPVVSKLIAGHSRIIMTLYYTKAGKAHVTEVMAEAERKMLSNEAASHKRFLMEKTYQEIEQRFAFVSPDALKACQQQKSAAGFILEDKGICPVGGGLCDVGGEAIATRGSAGKVYASVPGYPQERNCTRCRFFITGPAFLPGLLAHFNQVSYEATECSSRFVGFEQEIRVLEDARAECDQSGRIFTQSKELERAYQRYESEGDKANKLLTGLQACEVLITRSIEIANLKDKDGVRLVACGMISDIQYALTETSSEIHQLEVLCENAVIFPEVDASKAALRRSQILDAMLQMNGKPPIFFRLTPDQQLKVGNEVMKLIQARTGSLKNAVEFAEGRRMLMDLGILEETVNLIEDKTAGLGFRQVMTLAHSDKLMIAKDVEKDGDDES